MTEYFVFFVVFMAAICFFLMAYMSIPTTRYSLEQRREDLWKEWYMRINLDGESREQVSAWVTPKYAAIDAELAKPFWRRRTPRWDS